MSIKLNITKIKMILLLLLSGLPGCCLIFGNTKLRLSLIISVGFLICYIFFSYNKFIKDIFQTFNNKCGKILFCWFAWCFLSGIVACIFSNYNLGGFLYYYVFHIILLVYIPYYLAFSISQTMQINEIIKYYFIFLISIFALGIINFIFVHSNNDFLQTLFDYTLTNTRQQTIYSEIGRTKSTFVEPSYFANFIGLNLPLLYEFSKCKFKIFKSKILNIFSKKMLIPIAWFLLIATKSPIFLIFSILLTVIYLASNIKLKQMFDRQKLFFLTILIVLSTVIALLINLTDEVNINITGTYLKRIVDTVSNFSSFESLISAEPSLATRIVSMINQFIIAWQNPIFGIGYGNLGNVLPVQLSLSPVPLTYELINVASTNSNAANLFIFWTTLAETGIVGLILLYSFLFKVIKKAINLARITSDTEKIFLKSLGWGISFFTIVSIYDGEFATHILMLIGFIVGYNSSKHLIRKEY